MRGLLKDTYLEMIDRKLLYAFGAITVLTVLLVVWIGSNSIKFGGEFELDPSDLPAEIANSLIGLFSGFLSVIAFLAVMGTAGLIPNMLVKGRSDYFLSKPMTRTGIILRKAISIFTVYGVLISSCGLFVWLAILAVGPELTATIPYIFIFHLMSFFVWLSITFLAGVIFESFAMSIMSAFVVWVVTLVVGTLSQFEEVFSSKALQGVISVFQHILPKNSEMVAVGENLAKGELIPSWTPVWETMLFGVVLTFIMLWRFNRKSY